MNDFALIQIHFQILHGKFCYLEIASSSLVILKVEFTKVNGVHSADPVRTTKRKGIENNS